MRLELLRVQRDNFVALADAVFAVKGEKGKVKLNHSHDRTATGAVSGGFWGAIIGVIFVNPLLGIEAEATADAVSGALTDVGINDDFRKEIASGCKNGR